MLISNPLYPESLRVGEMTASVTAISEFVFRLGQGPKRLSAADIRRWFTKIGLPFGLRPNLQRNRRFHLVPISKACAIPGAFLKSSAACIRKRHRLSDLAGRTGSA